jgi:hypothetical protein
MTRSMPALNKIHAKHVQDSIWGVNTTSSATVVFDYLWQHMHSGNDRLFVVPFDKATDYKSKNAITLLKEL